MQFSDDILLNILNKKNVNNKISSYFLKMSRDPNLCSERYEKRSYRIINCMDLFLWDKYEQNKLLDLQKVNRCMDSRFCPNCRRFSLSSAIHNFSPHFKNLLDDGYYPYLLTLTIPNVKGELLRDTIKKLNSSFRKFYQKLSLPIGTGQHGFSERLIQFDAALKVLEITYNKKYNTYHPHFHIIIFSKYYDEGLFQKTIPGPYSKKRKSISYLSILDIHLMQIWKMCYDNIRFTNKNYDNMPSSWNDLYLCDIREMNQDGIYEVFKYTFKDTDILNYKVFYNLFIALDGQRIRQGHGLLFNVKVEEEAEGEKQDIDDFLEIKENPEQLLTREINELITVYSEYKKISRFKAYESYTILE